MDVNLTLILLCLCAVGIAPSLNQAKKVYEFPTFMSITFFVFILPQAVSLINAPGPAEGRPLTSALLYTCLCLMACLFGYRLRPWKRLYRIVANKSVDENRLLIGGMWFLAISLIFGMFVRGMTEEERGGTMWTGRATIYLFFTQLSLPATAIILRHAIRKKSETAYGLSIASVLPTLEAIIVGGRREPAIYFGLTLALVLYFERRIVPPRALILAATIGAMLFIPATGKYRSIASKRDWSALKELDFVGNFKNYLNGDKILELRNAAMMIDWHLTNGNYAFGAGYWDEMVWRFVPGQIVGYGLKKSLMINRGRVVESMKSAGYGVPVGSTPTGMGDSFGQFGFWGCLYFAGIAVVYRTLWLAANENGGVFAQLMYIGNITAGMRAVTHQSCDFIPSFATQALFMLILYRYAAVGRRNRKASPTMMKLPSLSSGTV